MKLYYSNTSAYSRKVRLVIHEKGLNDEIEEILIDPFNNDPELRKINPLGKVPVLVFSNGDSLFDSPLICRYLDSLSSDKSTIVPIGSSWATFRWESLADGMTDATYNLVMERRRPVSEQSSVWIARWADDISNALAAMEAGFDSLDTDITLAHLAMGVSIGYLDFRFSNLLYESACPQVAMYPKLVAWYEKFKTRYSMLATRPQE